MQADTFSGSQTIFAICFVNGVLATTHHPSLIVTGLVWLFQATTEQLSFVALLMCKLDSLSQG